METISGKICIEKFSPQQILKGKHPMPEIEAPAASPLEEPIWSTVRNPESVAEGLTVTLYGQFKDGHFDSETGQIAEFGAWPLPEVEVEVEEKLKRKIRLRNAGGAEPPKENP
jgi:hypothetical protein